MSFTNTLETALLDKEYGAVDYTPPATLFAALFTVVGADDGTGFTEVSGGAYARVAVTNNATNFPSANPKQNANAITFPTATANWQTGSDRIRGMGFFTASSGGTLRSYGYLCDQLVPIAVGLNTGDIVHAPGHSFVNGTAVVVWAPAGSTLPTGLATNTTYYVINVSGSNFQLSATVGGAAINITADGAMIIARDRSTVVNIGDTPSFSASGVSILLD